MRLRAVLFAILISLPALFVAGFGAIYVTLNVPGWIRLEPRRITLEYREVAERLVERPETAEFVGQRQKGWPRTGLVSGNAWGYVADGGRVRVWVVTASGTCLSAVVDAVRPVPYALVFYWGGSTVAVVLALLTALAVWSFLRFLRERDDFLAATAHDLTTPLAGLRLLIGRNTDDALMLVDRMLLLVANLKDFLKLGGRRPRPTADRLDLAALVSEAYRLFAEDYRDLFDGEDVAIRADGVVEAKGDATLVMQILWNLFGNDLKYAAPYGNVSVEVRREGRFAIVDFADTGQGMTRREMRKSFDRYYRAKTVMQSGKGGFGIGLCTSREFARSMGGDLIVRTNSPSGCVFTLSLPLFDAAR